TGSGRQREDGAADVLQHVPGLQGVQPGGERRRQVHGVPDGEGGGPGRGGPGDLPVRLREGEEVARGSPRTRNLARCPYRGGVRWRWTTARSWRSTPARAARRARTGVGGRLGGVRAGPGGGVRLDSL